MIWKSIFQSCRMELGAEKSSGMTFWAEADWHYRRCLKDLPVNGGQFDLNRFNRIAQKTDQEFKW